MGPGALLGGPSGSAARRLALTPAVIREEPTG